ncbi:TonB-dependent siderophore receptor [Ornithobacterium rhinotracheale]|uniref:TonB-dependent receptor plug domain-containing protein n=1 Tax=Ornithobacterium rhinotracheale TaxID=28251 RepID=UPI001FF0E62A|nr:TonB-dependent receptor plug domain-containing protein [Ornithobacterium rhinotracheale]MCK0200620.1 TonB-dependent receptor plug domain-containing protein [Ornithobacterium rhinotracheale]
MKKQFLALSSILMLAQSTWAQVKKENKNEKVNLPEIIFQAEEKEKIYSENLDPEVVKNAPSLTGSFTDILKTLPYVSVNTELSSQYMVRGGNYDENLIYVNGIQIYKPQLIRNGAQEGLNFLNPSMVANVNFLPGGWEAQFGDAMSSVLDVIYRTPTQFELSSQLSLMGGNLTLGTMSKNKKLSALVGARYLNRSLLLKTQEDETEFKPSSYDIQANVQYKISPKWQVGFIGNFNNSLFQQTPHSRETNFGTLQRPIQLKVYYAGNEKDRYMTNFGAITSIFKPNGLWDLGLDLYSYQSKEEEYFDIQGAYFIRDLDPKTMEPINSPNAAGQLDHARNDLDVLVAGVQHRGKYKFNSNSNLEWGLGVQRENMQDMLNEWQMIDSAGYNVPHGHQKRLLPGEVDRGLLKLNYAMRSQHNITMQRYTSFVQWSKKFYWNSAKVLLNAGVRGTYNDLNQELNISPRAQIAIRPDWVTSQIFRFATGYYVQPPFYKEFKKPNGDLNLEVKSQKSLQVMAGHDFEFFMWDRPFKLTTELYYKNIQDLNPVYIDNVRMHYFASNDAKGRAYGIDTRLYGEFIPGSDSWLSLSYAKSEQNIGEQGWIPRPTDPRFKASLFFQDYMPIYPSLKVNVNLIYASGLPTGAPIFTNPYDFTSYLPDYKRVDIGFSKILIDREKNIHLGNNLFHGLKNLSVGLEVFNVFDIKNTISTQWIRDVNSAKIYGVPNRLTGRFFNAKLNLSF